MGSCVALNCDKVAVRVDCAVHSWPALRTHQSARWLRLNCRDVKTVGSRKDVYSERFQLLSEHSGFCWRLRKPGAVPCYHPGRQLAAQYRSSGREREADKSTEDDEVEADGEGEMELDETEGIGEETAYLKDYEEGVIAL